MAPALAATQWIPFANSGVEYNSNVFAVPSSLPPFAASGNTQLGDVIGHVLAGLDTDSQWGVNQLLLNLQAERFEYDRFTLLDHNEYHLGGKLNWIVGPTIDGSVSYVQSRTMTPPSDTLSDQLEIQLDKLATATGRILLTPQWRFDLEPRWHELDSPLPGYPGFSDHETYGAASINYLGISKLTAGLRFEYGDGAFHGVVGATKYDQTTTGLTAKYAVTGLSSFDGQVGITRRDSSFINPAQATVAGGVGGAAGTTSTLTGTLGLHRQISVKTSVDVKVFREVDSYIAGANSEIGTGESVSATWSPDVKFDISLRYLMETQSIQGEVATFEVGNLTDRVHSGTLDVKYHVLRWLTLRPYYSYDDRKSNYLLYNYTMNQVGIDLIARFDARQQ
jgi:hypothetical protein